MFIGQGIIGRGMELVTKTRGENETKRCQFKMQSQSEGCRWKVNVGNRRCVKKGKGAG